MRLESARRSVVDESGEETYRLWMIGETYACGAKGVGPCWQVKGRDPDYKSKLTALTRLTASPSFPSGILTDLKNPATATSVSTDWLSQT